MRGGRGGYETAPPLAIFPETLDPPLGILAKTSRTPSPGFSTRVHLWIKALYLSKVYIVLFINLTLFEENITITFTLESNFAELQK